MASFVFSHDHDRLRLKKEGISTQSSKEQDEVEENCSKCFDAYKMRLKLDSTQPILNRAKHVTFLKKGLKNLSESYECLDASRPWLCYWILHSLALLEEPISEEVKDQVTDFLIRCQHPQGGFCGGPGQLPHLAPTYAAVNALCTLGTEKSLGAINRITLAAFIHKMRDKESGGFKLEETGETDVRGAYCAASVAHLTQIMDEEMFHGTGDWVSSCQTYEGGFAGCPEMEAHGGYSFCAFAALALLGKEKNLNLPAFTRWLVNRQMQYEGGFQGRTNKMVDGCYSFWQGGAFPLLHATLTQEGDEALDLSEWLFQQSALQEYILTCCQFAGGGLVDKPGKHRDFYHTCYCLSGLSVAQNNLNHCETIGDRDNLIPCTHPLYNICYSGVEKAQNYFTRLRKEDSSCNING